MITAGVRRKILDNCAAADMKTARRTNRVLIGQTRRGTVALAYSHSTKRYSLTTQDGGSWRQEGTAAEIKRHLIQLYVIEEG